ncbi:MAG TPA: hypothetical protein VND93_29005, partial [Myxococcales bacterium]|nr:hypothetical protein [Myxococcales bacterium]
MIAPPPLDRRAAADVVARLVTLLEQYTAGYQAFPGWKEYDPATRQPLGVSAALTGIFGRFAEIIIQRLNRVPDKSFLAFMDLLGAARLPPQPARVPLTFSLAAGRTEEATVPARTRVAAQPVEGDTGPVVFEVERALAVTAAQLASVVTFDPDQDTYGDSSVRDPKTAPPFLAFQGERPLEHVLYIGDDRLLGYSNATRVLLIVTLTGTVSDPRAVVIERWDGSAWVGYAPYSEGTASWSQSGTMFFDAPLPVPSTAVNGRPSRWLRARLLTPVTASTSPVAGMVRASQLPQLASLKLSVDVSLASGSGLMPDAGFSNSVQLDLSKEHYPFGERPRLFDTFYLASLQGFSKDPTSVGALGNASVELDVTIPAGVTITPSGVTLAWEVS